MKSYKNRKEVPAKYKWTLDFLLDGKTIEEQISKYETIFKKLIVVKDSKYESEKAFLEALLFEDKLTILGNKISNYLSNWTSEDVVNPLPNQLSEKFNFSLYQLNQEMGPELPRIFANETKIRKYLKSKDLQPYVREYNRIFEFKKHQLPKKIQEYRSVASRGNSNTSEPFAILTDAELSFNPVITKTGKKLRVGNDTITKLYKNKDQSVRKAAREEYMKGYLNVKQTLSNFLFQHFKSVTVEAKLHKFKDTVNYLLYDDRSTEKLLLAQYQSVQNHVHLLKNARTLHAKAFKAKYGLKMLDSDSLMPIVSAKSEMTIEEQKDLVLESLKPFGKEYVDVIKKAYADNWVDYKSYPGKRTGAYSIGGSYGVDKKLVLMNDDGSIRSAETLAHELGHSMHSYFSDTNQHLRHSAYKIFVAEIASIFNELMFFDHMLNVSTNDKLKLQIMHQVVSGFDGTVFRQTMWSNYEYDLYKAVEAGKPMSTFESLSSLYFENAKKYATKPLKEKNKEKISFNAIRVPHYYYGFYVYKYSIGQIVASVFFNRYKTHGPSALQDFIKEFLSKGDSLNPLDLLKHNNIDLEDIETFNEGFKVYEEQIKVYEKLIKKVYG